MTSNAKWLQAMMVAIGLLLAGCQANITVMQIPGQGQVPRWYVCRRVPVKDGIVVDGRMDEAAWKSADWTEDFVDIEGTDSPRPAPRFATRVKMLWDEEYLYVGAWMDEPHVWGTLTEYDQIVFHDNDFEIFIDPNGDTEEYYEIEINALNNIFDLFLVKTYINGGPSLHDWDLKGMKHAVWIDGTLNDPTDIDKGWSVEFALPWSHLAVCARRSCPPTGLEQEPWRINFSRVQWQHEIVNGHYQKIPDTPEDNWVWSPQSAVNMHLPEHWGNVVFKNVIVNEAMADQLRNAR